MDSLGHLINLLIERFFLNISIFGEKNKWKEIMINTNLEFQEGNGIKGYRRFIVESNKKYI